MVEFNEFIGVVNEFLYSKFLIAALMFVGLYFTIRTKFVQIRLLPDSFRVLTEKGAEGSISSFQALMIATASRVGTGNIAGVTTAIVLGGPGAVLWMWIMAIIGSASAFVESTLAQIYKEKDGSVFKGGPAYYIQRALGQRWLGVLFAIILILTFAFGFNGLQAYTLTSAFEHYVPNFNESYVPIIIGLILAAFSAISFFGGSHLIGKISSLLVPVMATLYILVGLIVFFRNLDGVGPAFKLMFDAAFDFKAIFGGFAGSCMVIGIKRGLFSNEAGMGSAPNAAASADVSHPVKQGLVQVLSVFIDTIVICSTTAFMALLAGPLGATDAKGELLNGIPFVQKALYSQFGEFGIHFVTICIVLFASTSLIGNYFYAEANMKFITKNNWAMLAFKVAAVVMVFVGTQADLTTAWNVADVLMGLMATVNIIAMLLLGGIAVKALNNYMEQKKQGLDPKFKASDIGLNNTDCWK
ncbi:MAG: alanine/glycine:cation symporter family protein [Anaerovoracaceae bacterium]